jgi:uncharacterized repeat protein (TIGR01451 family)
MYINSSKKGLYATPLIIGMMVLAAPAALAQNSYTQAGTSIDSTFTLNYSVAGTSQPQIDNTSTPTNFTVDRLVDLAVDYRTNSDDDSVAPGAQNEELVFLLRNDGNDNFAYGLSTVNESSGDDFDTSNLEIFYYVDDGDGLYEPGSGADDGAALTYSAATADLAPDAVLWVEIIGDIPASQPDTETSDVTLVADTLYPTTWLVEGSTGASAGTAVGADDGTNVMGSTAENVLNDGSGTSNESANAGDFSDTGTFTVSSPDLLASKAVEVVSTNAAGTFDCENDATVSANEYSIPGSCLEYTITVQNQGSAAATITTISDTLPDEFTFYGATFTNFTGGTPAQPSVGDDCDSGACVVSQTGGSIASGVTATIEIRVEVK